MTTQVATGRADRLALAEDYLRTPEARALAREVDRNEFLRLYSEGTGTLHEVWAQCRALKNQRAAIRRKLGR